MRGGVDAASTANIIGDPYNTTPLGIGQMPEGFFSGGEGDPPASEIVRHGTVCGPRERATHPCVIQRLEETRVAQEVTRVVNQ